MSNIHAGAHRNIKSLGFVRGRWAPIWGCCRGCGAHLIWVTSIDAFCLKKSQIVLGKHSYFTVLHTWDGFASRITNLGTFGWLSLKFHIDYFPGRMIFSKYSIGRAPWLSAVL